MADVCWIPEVQKTIISGTDEEFEACEADTQARLPELAATWLEERRNFFLTLLPRDSPTIEHLSLATTIFHCTICGDCAGMHIEKAPSHTCRRWDWDLRKSHFEKTCSAEVFHDEARSPWDLERSKYRYSERLSNIISEIVLECGEDPDTITTKEMIKKHLRFAYFRTNGLVEVLSWYEVVSIGACVLGRMSFLT